MNINEYFKRFYPADWQTAGYEFSSMLGGMSRYNGAVETIFPRIHCADGVSLSVQGHYGAYSSPRDDFADEYTAVEVGFIEDAEGKPTAPPAEEWARYAGGEFPSSVYGYVPVNVVEAFITAHGGMRATPPATPP